jgi:putative phosphoribosyl transferase
MLIFGQSTAPFADRREAGRALARRLSAYAGREDVLVLALPRGGVPVGFEVATALDRPLDVFVVRKLGVPGYEELAMGALASGGILVLNDEVTRQFPNASEMIAAAAAREQVELERREKLYRGDRSPPTVEGRVVILIDDGLATGSTMRAAARAVQQRAPARLIVAVPVAAPETCRELAREVDEVVCLITPADFHGVGQFYDDFSQTTDDEVRELVASATK